MTSTRHLAIAGAATALALSLTGCGFIERDPDPAETTVVTDGDGDQGAEPTDGGSTTPTDGGSTTPTDGGSTTTDGGATAGGVTAPGSQLKFGEKATLEDGKGHTLQVTVTEVRTGDPADLQSFDNASEMAGKTPYYVDFELTGTDSSSRLFDFGLITSLDPAASAGQPATRLNILNTSVGDYPLCPFESPLKLGAG